MTDPICPAGTLPRPDPRLWLGCTVTMETDRPIGYTHTKNGHTFTYPINYGYIPGVTGGDGEELDVYLLGVASSSARWYAPTMRRTNWSWRPPEYTAPPQRSGRLCISRKNTTARTF